MWKYIILVLLQTSTLAGGQAMYKLLLDRMHGFNFSWRFIKETTIHHGWIALLMVSFFCSSLLLWTYVLKKMPFSQAYPLSSLSFIFGIFISIFLFNESIPLTRWIGVLLIVAGCFLTSLDLK